MAGERVSIADVLAHVVDELRMLQEASRRSGHEPFMRFQECELELAFEAERSGQGGIKFWLLKLGGELKRNESNVLKVKMVSLTEPLKGHQLGAAGQPATIDEARPRQPKRTRQRLKR